MTFGYGWANYYRNNNSAIGQNIKSRLLLILGEWFLDINDGTPWWSIIGVKPVDLTAAETWIRQRVMGTEGVAAITGFTLGFDRISRASTCSITVRTIYSTQVTVTVP
jgi:hypothetical protein